MGVFTRKCYGARSLDGFKTAGYGTSSSLTAATHVTIFSGVGTSRMRTCTPKRRVRFSSVIVSAVGPKIGASPRGKRSTRSESSVAWAGKCVLTTTESPRSKSRSMTSRTKKSEKKRPRHDPREDGHENRGSRVQACNEKHDLPWREAPRRDSSPGCRSWQRATERRRLCDASIRMPRARSGRSNRSRQTRLKAVRNGTRR